MTYGVVRIAVRRGVEGAVAQSAHCARPEVTCPSTGG
jgi:hypothetical protein